MSPGCYTESVLISNVWKCTERNDLNYLELFAPGWVVESFCLLCWFQLVHKRKLNSLGLGGAEVSFQAVRFSFSSLIKVRLGQNSGCFVFTPLGGSRRSDTLSNMRIILSEIRLLGPLNEKFSTFLGQIQQKKVKKKCQHCKRLIHFYRRQDEKWN